MSDGSAEDFSKVVDEEFCANTELIIDGNKQIVLEETCTQPCPGNNEQNSYLRDIFLGPECWFKDTNPSHSILPMKTQVPDTRMKTS